MTAPWRALAWTVFAVCFISPFLILINKKIKTMPAGMISICTVVIIGMWLEHFLAHCTGVLIPTPPHCPLGWIDLGVALGFAGLLVWSLSSYLKQFPELLNTGRGGALMEILIAAVSLFTLMVVLILIGTRGRPMRFFTAFSETLDALWANRGPFGWIALCVVLVLGFFYFFYVSHGDEHRFGAAHCVQPQAACRTQGHRLSFLPSLCGAFHRSGVAAGGKVSVLS